MFLLMFVYPRGICIGREGGVYLWSEGMGVCISEGSRHTQVCLQGVGQTPPGSYTWDTTVYGEQGGGTHPTGMHSGSCLKSQWRGIFNYSIVVDHVLKCFAFENPKDTTPNLNDIPGKSLSYLCSVGENMACASQYYRIWKERLRRRSKTQCTCN